ncbi:unnamed protein product [Adineta ricciae]|uniref:Methyltransferase FkbM domain-containing protein n=1 Tax=Adineta ricciae TaxID=249248 RepID=A0A815H7E4_ADIRI|nr:unnamed protein product [Adineta ricciae]
MPRSKMYLLALTLAISFACYYFHSLLLTTQSSKIPISILTASAFKFQPSKYKVVTMDDRVPFYKLATIDGNKPYADGDRAQATIFHSLQLTQKCKQDPSLIVVDIGGFLGDFGLYAAACGCHVFIFEVQPEMVELIKTSVALNNFSTSRVHVIQKAVSNLPSNSQVTFASQGGQTTAMNGTLLVSTIRLDDIDWPAASSIILLKIDVEGFELNVLRSGEGLFREKRIQHVIFEYTAWWTDRAAQDALIPYVKNTLNAKDLYALDRRDVNVYGPLSEDLFREFHNSHVRRHLQTDIYARFLESNGNSNLEVQPYKMGSSFA